MNLLYLLLVLILCSSASDVFADDLVGRGEINARIGQERSIGMTEFWVPFTQSGNSVLYGDLRLMGDNQDNREGNLGVGYRQITDSPVFGAGVAGANIWIDRRLTSRGSAFHQITTGAEWLGEDFDVRANAYIPLSHSKEVIVPNANPQGPSLSGTGIVVDTNGKVLEEPQHGLDLELGFELGNQFDFLKNNTDSLRVYGGGYYFNGDRTEEIVGWRTRFTSDIGSNLQIGARFQQDDVRGSQGFLEATFRFPFGTKKSYRKEGLLARLDESPERDIDIVTGSAVTDTGDRVAVINKDTGKKQKVINVDNSLAGGGDGSAESPFNSLSDAEAVADAHSIIYVRQGNGMSSNQNQGITLDKQGQQLIGSGTNFIYDSDRFTTANGASPTGLLIAAATAAPMIGNINALQDGVTITANDIMVAGVTVDNNNTGRDGIVVKADSASATAQNVTIQNVTLQNNRMGLYLHGTNDGALSAIVQNTVTTGNSQHGVAVYDDTNGMFEVDLGGGSLGSTGNNVFASNTLEDLAVDYDGRTLSAQNNWWGTVSGLETSNVYYGIPLNEGLIMNWTFDDGTASDRSGNGYNGVLINSPSSMAGALHFDAMNSQSIKGPDVTESDTGEKLSISFIMTPDNLLTAQTLISKWDEFNSGLNNSWAIRLDNTDISNMMFFVADFVDDGQNIFLTSDANLMDNEKSRITMVYNGAGVTNSEKLKIYKDDIQLNGSFIGVMPTTLSESIEPIRVSYPLVPDPQYGKGFDGDIDDVRIYSRALTPSEISELYRMNTSSLVNPSNYRVSIP